MVCRDCGRPGLVTMPCRGCTNPHAAWLLTVAAVCLLVTAVACVVCFCVTGTITCCPPESTIIVIADRLCCWTTPSELSSARSTRLVDVVGDAVVTSSDIGPAARTPSDDRRTPDLMSGVRVEGWRWHTNVPVWPPDVYCTSDTLLVREDSMSLLLVSMSTQSTSSSCVTCASCASSDVLVFLLFPLSGSRTPRICQTQTHQAYYSSKHKCIIIATTVQSKHRVHETERFNQTG